MTIGVGGLGTTPLAGGQPGAIAVVSDPRYVIEAERRRFAVVANPYAPPSMQTFPKKYPGEIRTLSVDFAPMLETGESFDGSAIAWDVEVYSEEGTSDTNPSAITLGDPVIDGTKIVQRVTGGVVGVTYKMVVTGGTSSNQTLIERATMKVVEA